VKQKFQQKFYKRSVFLFDENFKLNLGKFFDPQELLREYGGEMNITQKEALENRPHDIEDLSEYLLVDFRRVYLNELHVTS
jgi:hypothetical protein